MKVVGQESKDLMKDLRKSHFVLASQSRSVYKGEFHTLPYAAESDVGDKLGLKKSHFHIGNDDPKRYYQSMYKRDNIEYKDIQPSKLEESLKNDLRRHHWGLGNDPLQKTSLAKDSFIKMEIPKGTKEEMLQVKQRNKKENLAWEDTNNYFSSTYTEFHVKNITPGQKIEGGFNKEELRKHTTELQASHLVFGSEDNDFGTSHANNFKNKSAKAEKAGPPIDLMKTNFYPGDDPIPTESLYKHYHKQMPIIKAALNEELKKDLRAHHFKYGDEKLNYDTVHKTGFPEYDLKKALNQGDNPLLYQNHFQLGDDRPEMKSLYKATHVEFETKKIEKVNHTKRDRSSNIVLGYGQGEMKSEAARNFVGFNGIHKATLEEQLRKDLRQSHFKFDDPTPYESVNHLIHKDLHEDSKKINSLGFNKELAKDLRKNHFEYGHDNIPIKSSMADSFKGIPGKSSTLEKELANDLRRNHFTYGTSDKRFDTSSYKASFGNTGSSASTVNDRTIA